MISMDKIIHRVLHRLQKRLSITFEALIYDSTKHECGDDTQDNVPKVNHTANEGNDHGNGTYNQTTTGQIQCCIFCCRILTYKRFLHVCSGITNDRQMCYPTDDITA